MSDWHRDVLGLRQQRVLRELGPVLCGQGAYLAGGTALALHLGHRVSVDLDFFQNSSFGDPHELVEQIKQAGNQVKNVGEQVGGAVQNTWNCVMSLFQRC